MSQAYEPVIGLEVHIQLQTRSKLFCADATAFGAPPNSQVSPVSLAHPGTLPVLNREAVQMAVQLGLALQCRISQISHFDRKHYFYPDLPKGYQTSQLHRPVLSGGKLKVAGVEVPIHHIHLEEDAGKSIHDLYPEESCIDLNRAGMPLLELVTEPAIFSADTAAGFLTELRKLVRWLGICDGNMEEGSLRCDANISIRPAGETQLGTKVEVKNLNSIRHVKRAIEAEVRRQTALKMQGKSVVQETRGYDADQDVTLSQREKEEANDYRYFPCPDLPPFTVSDAQIQMIRQSMPTLPEEMMDQLMNEYGLPAQDAAVLTEERSLAAYFSELMKLAAPAKPAANWLLGPVKSWLNEHQRNPEDFPLKPAQLNDLIQLVQSGKVNFSMAASRLLPKLAEDPAANAATLAATLGIIQESDDTELTKWVETVLAGMPDKVNEYRKGKRGLIGLFVGEVKKLSGGKANPQEATRLLEAKLKS